MLLHNKWIRAGILIGVIVLFIFNLIAINQNPKCILIFLLLQPLIFLLKKTFWNSILGIGIFLSYSLLFYYLLLDH